VNAFVGNGQLGGPPCPSGTVTLTDGTTQIDGGTFTLNTFGYFEDQANQLPVGTHTLKAVYAGDNSFNGSTSLVDTVIVSQTTTTTTVAASQTAVNSGVPVTLTATVASPSTATASAAQEPTGHVQFFSGGTALGAPVTVTGGANMSTSPATAQATATLTTSTLASGNDVITAQYLGDSNYAASTVSAGVTVSVSTAGINLAPATNTVTIPISAPGMSNTQVITVTGSNLVSADNVTLICAVTASPAGAVYPPTCNVFGTPDMNFSSPNIINLSATATTGNATMTVSTTPVTARVNPLRGPQGPNWFLVSEVGAFIACFFLLGISRQKRRSVVLLAMLLFAVLAVGTGCGSSYGGGGGNPGTTTGTYTIMVTATPASGVAQSTMIAVNVQ
jgi:hypothetical protein